MIILFVVPIDHFRASVERTHKENNLYLIVQMKMSPETNNNRGLDADDGTGRWMELRLSVNADNGRRDDVVVRCPAGITVGELTTILARRLDLGSRGTSNLTLQSSRVGLLAPGKSLQEVDLLTGDSVLIQRDDHTRHGVSPHADAVVGFELHVIGGPASGSIISLRAGDTVVGRDPGCELPIDDPSMSRQHFTVRASNTSFELCDHGSTNGTRLEGKPLTREHFVGVDAGQTISAGRTMITVRHRRQGPGAVGELGMVKFNRPPRIASPYDPPTLRVPHKPSDAERSPLQYGAMLVPLALGSVMAYVMKQPIYLLFTLMSPLMMLSMWASDRRKNKKGMKKARSEYKRDLERFDADLKAARAEEINRRRAECPDISELMARARERTSDLWERRPRDADFLKLAVGSGRQPSRIVIEHRNGFSNDNLELPPGSDTVDDVPITVDLPVVRTVGLYGDRNRVLAATRWHVAQAATLHDPSDLAIVAVVDDAEEWEWLKWLPHTDGRSIGLLAMALSTSRDQTDAAVSGLQELVATRKQATAERIRPLGDDPRRFDGRWVLLVVDENAPFDGAEMATLLEGLGANGTCCIWIGTSERSLPGSCGVTLGYRDAPATLTVTDVASGQIDTDVTPTGVTVEVAEEVARRLAPVRVADKAASDPEIPATVTLSELNGLDRITEAAVVDQWQHSPRGLRARVGATAADPFEIDLESDGPHGLVAGTTGAGKSEFLQSLVVNLAFNYTPDRIAFLFVDYKGGAAFKGCVGLPHSAGMVTDLDEHLAKRVLVSLQAEIRKREHQLREHSVKDMAELRRANPDLAVPSLLIVVDEFAALANEVPEFVDGLIDVAQRGRSLGIHLMLATQKPGGVVSANIRANMNLRVALRVADDGESIDIIDSNEAGRISRNTPGRAFARTGHSELTQFQAAYLGGSAPSGSGTQAEITVESFTVLDQDSDSGGFGAEDAHSGEPTELTAFSEAIRRAAELVGVTNASAPWLPPLPSVVPLDGMDKQPDEGEVVIGVVDEPQAQSQYPFNIGLAQMGGALIYGAGRSGKTTMLRTIAVALSRSATPDRLAIYGLDCAGRALMDIQELPNVGSVVPGDDAERTRRLLAMLRQTIERRGALFAEAGASDVDMYRELRPNAEPEPRIVLLLDSYAGFTDRYEMVDLGAMIDLVPRLMAEGPPVGVHVVATGDRRSAFPLSISSVVPMKFVLQMANEDEEISLGLPREFARGPKRPPGRGMVDGQLEFQVAIAGDDHTREGQANAIRLVAAELREKYGAVSAPAVKTLPTSIHLAELSPARDPWTAAIGLDDAEMRTEIASLEYSHFIVSGPYRSGRSQTVATILDGLIRSTPNLRLLVLAPRRSPLADIGRKGIAIARDEAAIKSAVEACAEKMPTRNESSAPVVIAIDDANEFLDGAIASALEAILREGIDHNVRVLAAFESQGIRTVFAPWIREIRKHKNGILLDPDHDLDGDILGLRLPRPRGHKMPQGRGYVARHGEPVLCQVALTEH